MSNPPDCWSTLNCHTWSKSHPKTYPNDVLNGQLVQIMAVRNESWVIFPTSRDIFQPPWQVIDETAAAAFFGGGARWTIRLRRVCVAEGGSSSWSMTASTIYEMMFSQMCRWHGNNVQCGEKVHTYLFRGVLPFLNDIISCKSCVRSCI